MTGLETENGTNFKTGAPRPESANLSGVFDQFRPVRFALVAMGMKGRPRQAEKDDDEHEQPHGSPVLIPLLGSQRSALLKNLHIFPLIFDL